MLSMTATPPRPRRPPRAQELGIAASDIKKLVDGGINTVEGLAHAAKKDLLAIKGLSEAKVDKLQKEGAWLWRPLSPPA